MKHATVGEVLSELVSIPSVSTMTETQAYGLRLTDDRQPSTVTVFCHNALRQGRYMSALG